MKINSIVFFGSLLVTTSVFGDAYSTLLQRYEKQIHQQEKQLKSLRARLQEKERDISQWKSKADTAKDQWAQASTNLEQTQAKVKVIHDKRQVIRREADAAQWKTTENVLISQAARRQSQLLVQDLYSQSVLSGSPATPQTGAADAEAVVVRVSELSSTSGKLAEEAQVEETALRTEEMKFQSEERERSQEAERLHQVQNNHWLKWQEALRRKTALEDEISQIDQSAKALQVMLQELRDHRDQARTLRENRSTDSQTLAGLKGTLPWPAHGRVVQNFGRQYPEGATQLVVSNGIKIDAGSRHTVRAIGPGKVLFANAFRQYGQLVIVQHKNGLTSVYAGLGQTQVKENQELQALDQIGQTTETGSFYFEIRHDEQPINPLVYLAPASSSELSLRRTFK